MEDNPRWARKTHVNLVRVLAGLTLLGSDPMNPTEKATAKEIAAAVKAISGKSVEYLCAEIIGKNTPTARELLEAAVAHRWNCSTNCLRKFDVDTRRPTLKTHGVFFDDLRQFGRARFDAKGALVKGSLGKGPDYREFVECTLPGRDRPTGRTATAL